MRVYCELASIPRPKDHFHVLRHSIAVHMADAGTGVADIQDWLGHKAISSTMVYMKITNVSRARTAKAIFGGEPEPPVNTPTPKVPWSKDTPKRR
jgi:site-specific recombinase XerD